MPGQSYDTVGVPPLIEGVAFEGLIADKAFNIHSIERELDRRGAKIVISQRKNRRNPRSLDVDVFKWRHLIENYFCKLKEFKRIAMRSDKTDQAFTAMVYLAAAVINSR
jgi:transposase